MWSNLSRKVPAAWRSVAGGIGGLSLTSQARIAAGISILVLILVFVIWSVVFKQWCELRAGQWGGVWGQASFQSDLGDCLRYKRWYRF